MTTVIASRHAFPEPSGFCIDRKNGHTNWTFLHFITPIKIRVDGEIITTKPNACIIYAPKQPQFFYSDMPVLHDWLHFDGVDQNFLQGFGLKTNTIYYPVRHEFITNIVREIENERNNALLNTEKLLSLKVDELLIKLHRFCQEQTPETLSNNLISTLRGLRKNLFSTLYKNHTIKSLASSIGLSQSRFFAVYKSAFGVSPLDDLINARIDVAKNQLLGSDDKISTIAQKLGYNDVTHFIRQFKAHTGVTPNQYRKQ